MHFEVESAKITTRKSRGNALQHQDIKRVFIGLDFLLFTRNKKLASDYQNSLFAGSWSWLMPYLLSTSTFKRSIKTIKLNKRDTARVYSNNNGFLDKTDADINHRLRFTEVLNKNFLIDPEYYGAFLYHAEEAKRLEHSLKVCLERNIEITLFISPVHARQLEAIRAMGLWDSYKHWQYDLVSLIQRLEASHNATINLWDFSGYNNYSSEQIPALGNNEKMQWYWESSHYKKSLGRLVVNTMLHRSQAPKHDKFGTQLNQENIIQRHNQLEVNRAYYVLNNPNEVAEITRLVDETRASRIALAKQANVSPLMAK